jgi:hypothetical protein
MTTYDGKVREWTVALVKLVGWFIKNHPTKLAELYSEPCTHFRPPSYEEADYFQWAWWHPESAQLWIAKLQLQKTYLEGSNERTGNSNTPNGASLLGGGAGWSGADGAAPGSDTMSEEEEFNRIMEDIERGAFDVETVDPAFEADIAKLEDGLAWQAEYEAELESQKQAVVFLDLYEIVLTNRSGILGYAYVLASDIETAKMLAIKGGQEQFSGPVQWLVASKIERKAPAFIGIIKT